MPKHFFCAVLVWGISLSSLATSKRNCAELFSLLKNADLPQRFELALEAVKKNPRETISRLGEFELSPTQKYDIYLKAARSLKEGDDTIAKNIAASGISEEQKTEIFRVRWDRNHGDSDEHVDFFKDYAFQDPESFFNILKSYARENPEEFLHEFGDDVEKLTENQKVILGKSLATEQALDEGPWIQDLHLKDASSRAQVLSSVLTRIINDEHWDAEYLEAYSPHNKNWFHISREEARIAIIETFKNVSQSRIRNREGRKTFLNKWCPQCLGKKGEKHLKHLLLARDPLGTIAEALDVKAIDEVPLRNDPDKPSILVLLDRFSAANPEILPLGTSQKLVDKIANRDNVRRLLEVFMSRRLLDGNPLDFKDSTELLAQVTGLNDASIRDSRAMRDPQAFFKLLLDLQEDNPKPIFEGRDFERAVFEESGVFVDFLSHLRNLISLREIGTRPQNILQDFFPEPVPLSVEALNKASQKMETEVVAEVRRILGGAAAGLGPKDYEALSELWGRDLDPIYTLIARFSTKKKWKQEIPIMGQALKAIVEGRFRAFKFENFSQMQGLGPKEREAWSTPRLRLNLTNGEQAFLKTEQAITVLKKIVSRYGVEPENKGGIEKVIEEKLFLRGNPQEILKTLMGDAKDKELLARQWLKSARPRAGNDPELSKSALRATKALLTHIAPTEEDRALFKEADQLIREADRELSQVNSFQNTSIILSALSADPKLLLSAGRLVQAASCLDYRSGGMIAALPAYLVDSNVQIVASFVLRQDDFENFADFKTVSQAIRDKRGDFSFDGNRRLLVFVNGDEKISSKPLEYAHLRQMLKLGVSEKNGKPALRYEKEYLQDHPALEIMRKNHLDLLKEVTKAIGATHQGRVRVPATINPSAIYSDLADDKGTQHEEYFLD